jgi:hypothetical protein
MDRWIEFLKVGDIVLGLLLTVGGGIIAFFLWWDRRTARAMKHQSDDWVASSAATGERIRKVEGELGGVHDDLVSLRRRIGSVETQMQGLASRTDVSAVAERVSRLEGTVERVAGQVDTIYRAALRDGGE